jgi:hypothetical protein
MIVPATTRYAALDCCGEERLSLIKSIFAPPAAATTNSFDFYNYATTRLISYRSRPVFSLHSYTRVPAYV